MTTVGTGHCGGMGRPHRTATGEYVYHVLNRANTRMPIFEDDEDYIAFEKVLAEAVERTQTRLLAYCVLPNHWHLIVWLRKDGRTVPVCRLVEFDPHAAVACPSPFVRIGPRLPGRLQVVSDPGRRTLLHGRALRRAECLACQLNASCRGSGAGTVSIAGGVGPPKISDCSPPGPCPPSSLGQSRQRSTDRSRTAGNPSACAARESDWQ